MLNKNHLLGRRGEERAAKFLISKGYTIVEQNYRCRYGEIDIIGRLDSYLVFIEVKTRSNTLFGSPQSSVTTTKQRQIIRSAEFYLQKNKLSETDARFDVVAIIEGKHGPPCIELFQNAFELH